MLDGPKSREFKSLSGARSPQLGDHLSEVPNPGMCDRKQSCPACPLAERARSIFSFQFDIGYDVAIDFT